VEQQRFDVYGIGNAIVDTEVRVEDLLIASHGLRKGYMSLVSADSQAELLAGLDGYARRAAAGGSAANTMVGVAQFGGTAFFTAKVGTDMDGALYRESMAEAGVGFDVDGHDGAPTGTCLVLVTPDGERTMQTSLGASADLTPADVDPARITRAQLLYVEGYLFGSPTGTEAAWTAMRAAKEAGVGVALSLSDPGMVEAFGEQFRTAVREYADIVFCNEHEARIYAGADSREAALTGVAADAAMVFMTTGADGCVVQAGAQVEAVAGHAVQVVDTTGAGDVFAAGVLYGLTHAHSPADAARLGVFASARIVTHFGPRLEAPLAEAVSAILAGAKP
jgi:sugar/nucleoside kinase (ribokinase family)